MRKLFEEYNDYTTELTKDNYTDFLYIFDTNTLLNLYRYSYETSNSFLKIIEKLSDNIWIPYHTALEFKNNRRKVINAQIRAFEETKNALNGNYSDLKSRIKKLSIENRHPSIKVEELSSKYKELLKDSTEMLDSLESKYKQFLDEDPILERIMKLFDNKVGSEPSKEDVDSWHKKASDRLKKKLPPGYMDYDKNDFFNHNGIIYEKKYSDYILWFQILDKLNRDKVKNAVLLTDDRKEDWFEVSLLDKVKILRSDLQNEVKFTTETDIFVAINSIDLIKFVSENKIIGVKDKSIEEMFEDSNYRYLFEDSDRTPYVLVLYPEENQAAVYNRGYQLIRESASSSLINFAIENHVQKEPFFSFSLPWQQPTWMRESIKGKCISYWLYNFEPEENQPKR